MTTPRFKVGQFVGSRKLHKHVQINEICPVPTENGEWRYWFAYTREDKFGFPQMHLAVADESELENA